MPGLQRRGPDCQSGRTGYGHTSRRAGGAGRSNTTLTATALMSHMAANYDLSAGPSNRRQPRLAQRMGLVPGPPPPLTEEQWEEVHHESQQRQDSYHPCAICQEPFGKQPQVLLSCSHVFHKACIAAYEKFVRTKQCPLCRTQEYRKRLIEDGLEAGKQISARRIQSVWRGFRARKAFFHLLLEQDPAMRRQYHYGIVKSVSDRYLRATEANARHLDSFFDQLDKARAVARLHHFTAQDWQEAQRRAVARGIQDCPICMQPLLPSETALPPLRPEKEPGDKVVLLSCSHCFHAQCIQSLEKFALVERDAGGQSQEQGLRCPVCRAEYLKQPLAL